MRYLICFNLSDVDLESFSRPINCKVNLEFRRPHNLREIQVRPRCTNPATLTVLLRTSQRIQYKRCLLVWALHELAPGYITNVQKSSCPTAARAPGTITKIVIPILLKSKPFSISGPSACNSFQDHIVSAASIDTFRNRHKPNIFRLSYPLSAWALWS